MKTLSKSLRLLAFAYPFVILFLRDKPYFLACALPLLGLLLIDFFLRAGNYVKIAVVVLCGILAIALRSHDALLRVYPFLMSLSILLLFWQAKDPSQNPMIGPMRKRVDSDPRLLNILHEAKRIWLWGLSLNTAILGILVFAFSWETWALYANLYSYALLFGLFGLTLGFVAWRKARA